MLAPTGTLRAVFLGDNPFRDAWTKQTGAASGTVPDLVKELARRLGVPHAIIPAPDAAGVIAASGTTPPTSGSSRTTRLARAKSTSARRSSSCSTATSFAAASPIQKSADVDRSGVTVGSVKGQTQELFVSSHLKNARVRLFPTTPPQAELERLLTSGEVDAFAINRQRSLDAQAASAAKLRALPDSFLDVDQCFVVAKGERGKLKRSKHLPPKSARRDSSSRRSLAPESRESTSHPGKETVGPKKSAWRRFGVAEFSSHIPARSVGSSWPRPIRWPAPRSTAACLAGTSTNKRSDQTRSTRCF